MMLNQPSIPIFLASLAVYSVGFHLVASGRGWFGYPVLIVASVVLSWSFSAHKRKKKAASNEG